jgi:hypothetical protein
VRLLLICPLAECCGEGGCGCRKVHELHSNMGDNIPCLTGESCLIAVVPIPCRPATEQEIEDYTIECVANRLEGKD